VIDYYIGWNREAMALKQGDEKVKRLYKYRPNNNYTLRLLEYQELYFSFIKDFNDPFDCRIIIDCIGSDEKSWRELAEKKHIPEPIRQEALEGLRSIGFEANKIKQIYDKSDFKTEVIYCLSEIKDNILMWSHYTNSHRGICIGFETSIQFNSLVIKHNDLDLNRHPDPFYHNFLPISKIEYQNQYPPSYNIFKGEAGGLFAFLATKGEDWKYEKEHRIILPYGDIKKNIIKFDKSILKEVIVGSKAEESFMKQVFDIIKKNYLAEGYPVEVFESSLDDKIYKLNIKKIN